MSKGSKSSGTPGNAVFFKPISGISELKSGYLNKSPPQKKLKLEKSWKKRFFVLFRISENHHQLMYFSSEERKEPLGAIDLSQVSVLHRNPQHRPQFESIQKTFKCPPSSVLYIKVEHRDYFLIGETSEEMDSWFSVLFDAMKDRPFLFLTPDQISSGEKTIEDISRPIKIKKKSPAAQSMTLTKKRSQSVPDVPISSSRQVMNDQRPVSYPSKQNPFEDPPVFTLPIMEENEEKNNQSSESLYEPMLDLNLYQKTSKVIDEEVEDVLDGTLLRSVNEAFDKFRKRISPTASIENEKSASLSEKNHHSSSSSCSSNSTMSSIENIELFVNNTDPPEEIDIEVNTVDLKKHLTLDMDGKPRVSSWTGLQQHTLGLFLKGDQILAVNDLLTVSLDEFNMFVSKCLKDKVKVTILRLSGGHLHGNIPCNS